MQFRNVVGNYLLNILVNLFIRFLVSTAIKFYCRYGIKEVQETNECLDMKSIFSDIDLVEDVNLKMSMLERFKEMHMFCYCL